jgi:hypothetical protein
MKVKLEIAIVSFLVLACGKTTEDTVQIGENTFVHKETVYRIIENQITELGSLRSDTIAKSMVLNPQLRDFGSRSLSFITNDARAELTAVYRGNILYFKMAIQGLNDLREKYYDGSVTLNLLDEYDFEIQTITIGSSELVKILGRNGQTMNYEFNGRVEMSSEMYQAIARFSVSASLRKRIKYGG